MPLNHIYFFSSYNTDCASTRYRGLYVLDSLKENHDISSDFVFPSYEFKHVLKFIYVYLKALFRKKTTSVVILQKLHTNGIYTRFLKFLVRLNPKGVIYDTDDADYLRYEEKNINFFLQRCHASIAGSQHLLKRSLSYNEKSSLLTSSLIPHSFLKEQRNNVLNIGWIGDYGYNYSEPLPFSHKRSLFQLLFPAVKALDFDIKLTLLGVKNPNDKLEIQDYFKDNSNIELDIPLQIDWLDEQSIYKRLKQLDVGVSPLVPHEFNQAKSAFKVKQYLSCGVPVLASPVGENLTFVKDKYNGYLCENAQDFSKRIREVNSWSKDTYQSIVNQAQEHKGVFSISNYSVQLLKHIEKYELLK